jgi:hypothetical protein
MEPLERRSLPIFGQMQAKIWGLVAEEVGQKLTRETAP